MKKNSFLIQYLVLPISFLFFPFLSLAADTYTLDPQHTYVAYHINHLGFSTQTGKWMANGTLVFDEANPSNSKVNATIDAADVITGNPKLKQHLNGKQFFDVAQFPQATFVSDKIESTGKNTALMHGTLTVHGVAKPITLEVTLNKQGINPVNNKMAVGFSAKASLKRSDFGINTLLPALGDEVVLNIEAEGYKSA